jgi:hypothetical protein
MNIDISGDPSKTVAVGSADKTGSLFSIEKPKGVPLAGGVSGSLGTSRPPSVPVPPQRPSNPPPQQTRASDAHDMLSDLANPVKDQTPFGGGLMGSDSDDSMTEGGDSLTDGTAPSAEDYIVDEQPEEDQPSPGFVSIDDEKSHILWKLSRAKRNGMPVHRNLTIDSNIRELRNELKRVEYELSLSQSLRFQKRMLCLAVSGMEVLTERYSLFDLQLQGWSSQVQDDIDSFDSVLSRLHDKYKDRAAMAPELQLLLMLVSSAISFHVTKSMMKSISQPGGGGLGGLLQSMMGGGQVPKPTASIQEMNEPRTFQRAPMRGPTPMGAMGGLGAMGTPDPSPTPVPIDPMGAPDPMRPPQLSREKRPRDEEDRISDVVSETSDDSTTPGKSESSESSDGMVQIQTIPAAGRGRGRGSRGGRGRGAKTVVTL